MSEKKLIIAPGGKVIIEINPQSRSKSDFVGHLSPKGLIKTRRENEYLPRRLKKKSGIRFFDLGRLANGDDVSGFIIQPAFPFVSGETGYAAPTATLADLAALDEYLFNLDGESFESKFYEIKRVAGDFYRLQIFGDSVNEILTTTNDLWTEKGVNLSADQLNDPNFTVTIQSDYEWRYKLFFGFKTSGVGKSKVTLAYDYEAEEVSGFKLQAGDLVFLYPMLCSFKGTADWFFGGRFTYLHYDLRLGRRNYYEANQSPVYDPQHLDWTRTPFSSDPNYLEKYNALQNFISLPSARAWKIYQEWDEDDNMFWDFAAVDPETGFVPDPPFDSTGDSTATEMGFHTFVAPQYAAGMLLAVVKRGSDLFHVWAN